jgi:hypothetical protein
MIIIPIKPVTAYIVSMVETIKNYYKMARIFRCKHPMHKQFDYSVSPYHILKLKKCYKTGCVEYQWRCYNFEKGEKCPRDYKHVGRKCSSCKKYHENKIVYQPETKLNANEMKRFLEEFRNFEGWVEEMRSKSIRFSGTIESIKPHLMMKIEANRSYIYLDSYFASLGSGYIDNALFDDRIYIKFSYSFLRKFDISSDDEIEVDVRFNENNGRIILANPKNTEIIRNGRDSGTLLSKAQVARATGKIINGNVKDCANCPYITLIDIDDQSRSKRVFYRRFYCLRGVSSPENCPVRIDKTITQIKNTSI